MGRAIVCVGCRLIFCCCGGVIIGESVNVLEQVLADSPVKLAADPLVELEGEKSGIKIVFESNRECSFRLYFPPLVSRFFLAFS